MAEYMFLSIDPSFELATRAVAELRNQNRLVFQHNKLFRILRVKSANDENNLRFRRQHDLARRLGVCARICMADSTGCVNPMMWGIDNCYYRNYQDPDNFESNTTPPAAVFQLANNEEDQMRYCSEYDRFYPHYVIQQKLRENHRGNSIPSRMLIFRQNFQELIEINTTMYIEDQGADYERGLPRNGDGRYKCRITVFSQRYTIEGEMAENRKFTKFLITLGKVHAQYTPSPQGQQDQEFAEALQELNLNEPGQQDGGDGDQNQDDSDSVDELAALLV